MGRHQAIANAGDENERISLADHQNHLAFHKAVMEKMQEESASSAHPQKETRVTQANVGKSSHLITYPQRAKIASPICKKFILEDHMEFHFSFEHPACPHCKKRFDRQQLGMHIKTEHP